MAQIGAGLGMGRDADSFYVEDCRKVQSNTHAIQNLTGQISRMVGTLEAEKDFQHCRKMVDDAVRQASETRSILMRIKEHQQQAQNPGEKNNRRMMYQKLSDNLAITARVLEDVVRRFTAEEKKYFASFEEYSSASAVAALGGPDAHSPRGYGLGFGAGDVAGGNDQQPLLVSGKSMDQELEQQVKTEKVQALRRVDEDMKCLQRIYTDLAAAADEQQHSFDSLESHMASAAIDVERGREEISLSHYGGWQHQLKRRVMYGGAVAVALFLAGSLLGPS